MAWWIGPLAYRLYSTEKDMQGRGEFTKADALYGFVRTRHREIQSCARHFFSRNKNGGFLYPVKFEFSKEELKFLPGLRAKRSSQPIDELWPRRSIEGTRGMDDDVETINLRITPLAKIPSEQRRQVDAFAHILVAAVMAARERTNIVSVPFGDALRNPDHASSLVGVSRIASRRAWERGIGEIRIRHAKGVASKIAGQMYRLYGLWRWRSVRQLTAITTGVSLTEQDLKTLADNLIEPR